MYKYLPIILLTGCIETIEIPAQVNAYVCDEGWQWTLQGEPILDEKGRQLTCTIANNN